MTVTASYERGEEMGEKCAAALAKTNVRMKVGGCGCCGSPDVTLEIDGELIIDDEMYVVFDMFKVEE